MKKLVMGVISGACFGVFMVLAFAANRIGASQADQTVAARWSEEGAVSQVSCFFSVNSYMDEDRIREFEHSIDSALADASVTQESPNPGARLWVDAYSASGVLTVSRDRASVTADAYGIGGDFFLFHPLRLLSGSYFSGNDVLTDYCMIDQDVAWQLFGSNDVAGQIVYIGGVPHVITGVVERPGDKLHQSAGLDGACVFVSYDSLKKYGVDKGVEHYEILMPNPVTNFAYDYVKQKLGTDEREAEVIENSSRFSLMNRFRHLAEFTTRSMNGKAIIFPYWENLARSREDKLSILLLLELLFLLPGMVLLILVCILLWRGKGWTIRGKLRLAKDKLERKRDRRRAEKQNIKQARKQHKKQDRNKEEEKLL